MEGTETQHVNLPYVLLAVSYIPTTHAGPAPQLVPVQVLWLVGLHDVGCSQDILLLPLACRYGGAAAAKLARDMGLKSVGMLIEDNAFSQGKCLAFKNTVCNHYSTSL